MPLQYDDGSSHLWSHCRPSWSPSHMPECPQPNESGTDCFRDPLSRPEGVRWCMDCSSCKGEVPAGSKFCIECGASLLLACSSCGHDNPPQAKFCANCGAA